MIKLKSKSKKITKQKVWKVFSQYIRLKYADKDGNVICYTCGKKMNWKQSQCGHGLAGRTNSILFDEEIVRPQCVHCNIFLHGALDIFALKLVQEYSLKHSSKHGLKHSSKHGLKNAMEWWNAKVLQKHTVEKFTQDELRELYEHYNKELQPFLLDKYYCKEGK